MQMIEPYEESVNQGAYSRQTVAALQKRGRKCCGCRYYAARR